MRRKMRPQRLALENSKLWGFKFMKHKLKLGTFALGLLALTSVDAQAQVSEGSSYASSQGATSFAGAAFGSPLAYGASWGNVGLGVYAQTLSRDQNGGRNSDGAAAVAFGLGDADKYVGLETDVSINHFSSRNNEKFLRSGALSFKLHTNLPGGAAFAVGVVGASRWGGLKDSDRASVYAVGTKVFKIGTASPHPLVVNLGLGDEGFQELDRSTGRGKSGAGIFGSVAFYVVPQVSLITDYTGRFLNAAVSVAPFKAWPLVVTVGAVNLTKRYDLNTQAAASVSYGFTF
jgi:hypothetical protein